MSSSEVTMISVHMLMFSSTSSSIAWQGRKLQLHSCGEKVLHPRLLEINLSLNIGCLYRLFKKKIRKCQNIHSLNIDA